ncbi:MAG TPA: FtsX-like permease family protein [Thermoanaerobaculia bacterium]|jgi:putative ABC transport system permease protein|nr:FtsX-like permease family protein [Thermoanaerobaculia bacterium]
MRAWAFALRSLLRQPARSGLGILGVTAVGTLLFDMLLLSRGLEVSFRHLLDATGFDVRVMAAELPFAGPRLTRATATAAAIARLPEVAAAVPIAVQRATARTGAGASTPLFLLGAGIGAPRPWVVAEGGDLPAEAGNPPAVMVNRRLAGSLHVRPGDVLMLSGPCGAEPSALPAVPFRIAGVAEFPFEEASQANAGMRLADLRRVCGKDADEADLLLVQSRDGVAASQTVQAIHAAQPELYAFSNAELVAQFEQAGFSYFRQISVVLATVTLFFGFLLITALLTVSVNQRFGEIAAVRALGFSRRRVVADVFCQSAVLVGTGGLLALPAGFALARWLDAILRSLPEIPARLHFFVFQPRALVLHLALMVVTAVLAALYPMRLVARLPIAATLREEVVS